MNLIEKSLGSSFKFYSNLLFKSSKIKFFEKVKVFSHNGQEATNFLSVWPFCGIDA